MRIKINAITSVVDLKTFLSAQQTKGTPLQVCYQLAEPEPFQVTGNQPVPALSGTNTLLTDADSVSVSGRADPLAAAQETMARIAALEQNAIGG